MMGDDGYRRVQGRGVEVIRELMKPIVDEYYPRRANKVVV